MPLLYELINLQVPVMFVDWIGFFHTNNGRKDSLVYDLMEPFRQTIIDRFVLKLLNYGTFKPTDFEEDKENGLFMAPLCNACASRIWKEGRMKEEKEICIVA